MIKRAPSSVKRFLNPQGLNPKKVGALFLLALVASSFVCDLTEGVAKEIKELYWPSQEKNDATYVIDDTGVPLVDYGYIDGVHIGVQRNPVTVEMKALLYYEAYEQGCEEDRQLFLNCADWLVNNSKEYKGCAVFEYEFPWSYGGMTPPWRSGMAQGMALQVLIRAHDLTRDEKYLMCAEKSLALFFIDVEDGGVTRKHESNGWWYEEYADEGSMQTKVLNGMMFAVVGIYEYSRYTGDEDAQYLLDEGIKALKNELPYYDNKRYSSYDILGNHSGQYHEVHIQLLERLHTITGEGIFKQYHERWESYEKSPYAIQLILNPTKMRVLFYAGNTFVLLILFWTILYVIERLLSK
ncbi:MAG: hypothetical protein HXS44_10350 [Theionarchaea archaeon]|nr:hypothetical protein [Theionarchaea archaeon]